MIKTVKPGEYIPTRTARQTAPAAVAAAVAEIIKNVTERGDAALRDYSEKFDGCVPAAFELEKSALDGAMRDAGAEFIGVMERAARNIEDFHRRQISEGFVIAPRNGVVIGQRVTPIDKVGVYVPGGTAAYPSTVLMNCIPAKLAGAGEIIIATPPQRGGISSGVLAAAKIAGADRVFAIGGAQAIAALAYGTETVPRVDKITGPGNAYVAEAKRQVFGIVGIDMIAGPSDILVIASDGADPVLVAADMLSQCEHGGDSSAILVTDSKALARSVGEQIEAQLASLPREQIARAAVDNNSMIIIAASINNAFEIANEIAPEHLEIMLDDPFMYLSRVRNAGSVFLGKCAPEALGDYYAGPNHTLPTSGTARFSSPLSVGDFVKKTSFTYYSEEALRGAGGDVVRFASKEGLEAHAISVQKRMDGK